MPTPRPWEERLTPIDLFVEKRRITRAWRIIASISVILIGIGCLLYPFAIKDDSVKPVSYPTLITAVSLTLLGHALEIFAILRQKSILYWLEDFFLPILHIGILTGVIAPVFHITYRHLPCTIPTAGVYIISGLSLLVHIPASAIVSRRVTQIERADTLRRQRVSASPSSPWPARYNSQKSGSSFALSSRSFSSRFGHWKAKTSPSFSPGYSDDTGHIVPEDEAQRQQLMKLLMKREDESRPPVVTGPKGGGVQTTYRLDLPIADDDDDGARRRHLSAPGVSSNRARHHYADGYRSRDDSLASGSATAPPGMIALQTFREIPQLRSPPRRHVAPAINILSDENDRLGEPSRSNSERSATGSDQYANSQSSTSALRPTPSQADRERRRREIEEGQSDILPPYAEPDFPGEQRDNKGSWGTS